MRRPSGLGLRGRLALSIGAIVTIAFAVVFVAVKAQMDQESSVINREEAKEKRAVRPGESGEHSSITPIEDARSDVEKTFLLVGGASLVAALIGGYLLAARTAGPLRRFADTATRVDAGDLTPRLEASPSDAAELRTLAEAFNHMLDRLDDAFARQREFVSDASHELRSPLTVIRGQLEVLAREESPGAEQVRRVERVAITEIASGRAPGRRPADACPARRGRAAGPRGDRVRPVPARPRRRRRRGRRDGGECRGQRARRTPT